MSKETRTKTSKYQCNINGVIHRFFRVLSMPLLIITASNITISCIISVPIWIITGQTIVKWSCELMAKHMEYCFD